HTPTRSSLVDAEKPRHVVRYLLARRGLLTSNVAEAVAMIHTESGLAGPDVELIFAPVPFLDHGFTEPPGHGFTIGVVLLHPAGPGRLSPASADPTVPVAIDPNDLSDPDDLRRLIAGGEIARKVLAASALAPHLGEPMRPDRWPVDDGELEQLIRAHAETLYH